MVPGALALSAIGALSTYHVASRAVDGNRQSQRGDLNQQPAGVPNSSDRSDEVSASDGGYAKAELAERIGTNISAERDASAAVEFEEEFPTSQRLEGGANFQAYDRACVGVSSPKSGAEGSPLSGAGGGSLLLAEEFRRLTDSLKQQTRHLVEAVGAMKALASRAEQDSSSLLAARVSSHTSELRAELDTIKQLLLLQGGGLGGRSAADLESQTVSAADNTGARSPGAIGAEHSLSAKPDQAKEKKEGNSEASLAAGLHSKASGGEDGVAGKGNPVGTRGMPMNDEEQKQKANEGTSTAVYRKKCKLML